MLSVDAGLRSASQKPHTHCEITKRATMAQVNAFSFDVVKTVRITENTSGSTIAVRLDTAIFIAQGSSIYQKLHVSTSIMSFLG